MNKTKHFLRPLLMAIVMMVGMLVPQGAWAQYLEVWEEETISSDASYDGIEVHPGGVLIINEGVTLTLTSGLYIHGYGIDLYGTVINYGTIKGEGSIDMQGGVLANHGHIDLGYAGGYGTFYNTGTLGDNFHLTPTECYHDDSEDWGEVDATCTHGAGTQFKCYTCHYIWINETGDPLPHDNHDHNGLMVCSVCGHTTFDAPTVGEGTAESPYQIANAGHLFWFADKVNNDFDNFKDANAVLTADIVVNDGTFADDGTFTATGASEPSTPIEWLIIARFITYSHGYRGTFDGQGHTISGLYANYDCSGLVGMSSGESKIKNVGVTNSYFSGHFVGGICGDAGDNTEISNCYSSNVICKGNYVGGILGYATSSGVSIVNCYSTASLIGVEDWAHFGGIAAQSCSTTNCYTTYGNATEWSETEINCEANVSLERFASGEIAYKLNGSVDGEGNWTAGATDGTQKWYQAIGTDAAPVLVSNGENTVYAGYESCASENLSYSNANTLYATKEEAHVWEDGKCTVCKTECEHDWESDDFGHGCTICDIDNVNHDWSNGDSKCAVCEYVCQHKVEDDDMWEYGECTICGYECKHKDSDNDDYCDICGIQAQTFESLAALIAAGQDYDAVNVTIDEEILMAMPHPDSDFSGMYLVALKSGVQLVAPIPEPALNWQPGGTIKGTVKYADWGEIDNLLTSKDASFWSNLTYTPGVAKEYNSIEELLAADLENGTPVTVTVNGTITETPRYLDDAKAYQIVLDNGFVLGALEVAADPGWVVGGTISGTLENVTFMKNDEAEEVVVGIMSLNRNIFTELNYTAPAVTIGGQEIEIALNSQGKYETTTPIALTDDASFTANVDFTAPSVNYTRDLSALTGTNWGTLCVPFELPYDAAPGVTFYTLTSATAEAITLSPVTSGSLAAGTPVLFKRGAETTSLGISINSSTQVKHSTATGSASSGLTLTGTYVPTQITDGYYLATNGKVYSAAAYASEHPDSKVQVGAFRAWFAGSLASSAKGLILNVDDDATALEAIDALTSGKAEYYDMQGRKLNEMQRGINIVRYGNGKTVKVNIK